MSRPASIHPVLIQRATALAHEAALTLGRGDPDDQGAFAAQEHRRLLRETLLRVIADLRSRRWAHDGC